MILMDQLGEFTMVSQPIRLILVRLPFFLGRFHFIFLFFLGRLHFLFLFGRLPFFPFFFLRSSSIFFEVVILVFQKKN